MIRIIAIISVMLMPVISVSTTSTDRETVLRSNDICDAHCGTPQTPKTGDGGGGSAPFAGSTTVRSGS